MAGVCLADAKTLSRASATGLAAAGTAATDLDTGAGSIGTGRVATTRTQYMVRSDFFCVRSPADAAADGCSAG